MHVFNFISDHLHLYGGHFYYGIIFREFSRSLLPVFHYLEFFHSYLEIRQYKSKVVEKNIFSNLMFQTQVIFTNFRKENVNSRSFCVFQRVWRSSGQPETSLRQCQMVIFKGHIPTHSLVFLSVQMLGRV